MSNQALQEPEAQSAFNIESDQFFVRESDGAVFCFLGCSGDGEILSLRNAVEGEIEVESADFFHGFSSF